MPTYTYTNIKDQIADPITLANIGNELTILNVINRTVRVVNSDIDLRSLKRRTQLTSKIFDDEYSYPCPTDLKGDAIIDLPRQKQPRSLNSAFYMSTPAKFDRTKSINFNQIAVHDSDFSRRILANLDVEDTTEQAASLDSTTADGGTWELYGNATIAADTDQYIEGSGSLNVTLTSGGTTAGIQNTGLNTLDISDYTTNGSIFVWAYIVSTSNLTNFILDIGNDLTTNYYTQTVTAQADGTAFQAGWNLLRFDFASMTQNGTVTPTSVDSIRLYITKSSGKTGAGYRFDDIQLHTGEYYDIVYYSKYGWQTSSGTYIENSTTSTDKINCDTDELDLYVFKGKAEMYRELENYDQMKLANDEYERLKAQYQRRNPSERLKHQINYY